MTDEIFDTYEEARAAADVEMAELYDKIVDHGTEMASLLTRLLRDQGFEGTVEFKIEDVL